MSTRRGTRTLACALAASAARMLSGFQAAAGAQEAPVDSAGGHEVLDPAPAADSAAARAVSGDDATIETLTRVLASELRCPVCQGLSIQDSPTELSQQMKDVIRDQLRAGKSPEEVKAYFVARYGEWILLQPEPAGFNLMVYVLPWLALAIGGLVLVRLLRRWTKADEEPAAR